MNIKNTVAYWLISISLLSFNAVSQAADEIVYFHPDALGSATMAYNVSGELCWTQNYTPYGDKTNSDDVIVPSGCGLLGGERGYTGHVQDFNGLVYAQQRYYDPSIMRFLSLDPADVVPEDHKTFNRYSYAANNPYKYVDPDGRAFETVWDVANIALGLASFSYNVHSGNYGSAAIDAVGILIDSVATAIPVVPGGVGTVIKSSRTVKAVDSVSDVPNTASWKSDPYHPNWKNFDGPKSVGADVVRNTLPANARTFSNEKAAFQHLDKFNGISPNLASERLHQIKQAAQTSRGGADNVLFDRSGGVWDPKTREFLGSLTEGGAK
jgi:RHS repeat-associated protein